MEDLESKILGKELKEMEIRKIVDARDLVLEYNKWEQKMNEIKNELINNFGDIVEMKLNEGYNKTKIDESESVPTEISFLLNPEEAIFDLIKSKVISYENERAPVNEDSAIRSYNDVAEQVSKNASLFKSIVKATDSAYIPTYNEDTAIAAIYLFKAGYNKNEVINLLKERYNMPVSLNIDVIENVERSLDNYNFKLTTKFKRD